MTILTPALVGWLQTSEAAAWLDPLTTRPPADADLLPTLTRLRQHLAPEHAAAVVETARLRQHAAAKFSGQAGCMYFARPWLEQASPAPVAAHTARRFAGCDWVADLGCGLGADSLALAEVGPQVLAIDQDPLALALITANARALNFTHRILPIQADVRQPAWRAPAAWADPGRRADDRRLFDPERLQPPLSALLEQRRHTPSLGVKLAPGLAHEHIPADAGAEWISLNGELKETVLWFGNLAGGPRRLATLLPGGAQIAAEGIQADVRAPGRFLYEPDSAILRASAVGDLAQRLGLWQIDREIAYLCGDELISTPFARAWPILEHLPFDLKALNRRLRALQGHVIAVKKRGSPIEPEAFRRRLYRQLEGQPLIVVLTRVANRPWMLICSAAGWRDASEQETPDVSC